MHWEEGNEAERHRCLLYAFTIQSEAAVKKYPCLLKANELERCIVARASSPFMCAAAGSRQQ